LSGKNVNNGHATSGRRRKSVRYVDANLLGFATYCVIVFVFLTLDLMDRRMSQRLTVVFVLTGIGLALAGCGYSQGDRAASGGLIGAGAGAALAGVTGGSMVGGALIGGAVGAVGGAVTSPEDVNLGRPAWR
jgi:hypothetical protein